MSFDGIERRKHPRRAYCEKIQFCQISRFPNKLFPGASVDISDSGMRIYTLDKLVVGDSLEIKTALPVPFLKATVKWVEDCAGVYYKAGIMFH